MKVMRQLLSFFYDFNFVVHSQLYTIEAELKFLFELVAWKIRHLGCIVKGNILNDVLVILCL